MDIPNGATMLNAAPPLSCLNNQKVLTDEELDVHMEKVTELYHEGEQNYEKLLSDPRYRRERLIQSEYECRMRKKATCLGWIPDTTKMTDMHEIQSVCDQLTVILQDPQKKSILEQQQPEDFQNPRCQRYMQQIAESDRQIAALDAQTK